VNARTTGIVASALAGIVVLATSLATADESSERRGRAIAQSKCARCHAIGVEGDSPVALAPPFRVLPQRYPVENLAEALAEGIYVGHPMMPEFKFDPPEIDALLAFIEDLAKRAETSRKPPAPVR
jgi:mono/diheme cytochrome c family protein